MDEKLKSVIEENSEQAYGYISLFRDWQMAKRTICVTLAFTASAFVYYQLVINIGNMAGNTFLNMFLLGLVEGPGCVAGVYLSDKVIKIISINSYSVIFFRSGADGLTFRCWAQTQFCSSSLCLQLIIPI